MKQLSSYVFVGGSAALIEWISFFILAKKMGMYYISSTIIAFMLATFTNWLVGRNTTFKNTRKDNILNEIFWVYIVSAVGLIINVTIMFLFVNVLLFDTMIAKIIGTGIVFIWNFVIRQYVIYKN